MNRVETIKIITFLAGNYESISNKTKEQKEMMVNTWLECLGDLDYKLVAEAVKMTIIKSPYIPTIHEIRKNAIELSTPQKNTAVESWNECYKMICNGIYMTQEEFDSHSEICKRFLGSVNQLKAYASNDNFNMDVVRSNFFKQYDNLTKREEAERLLPENIKSLIKELANNMDIKKLES